MSKLAIYAIKQHHNLESNKRNEKIYNRNPIGVVYVSKPPCSAAVHAAQRKKGV